MQTGVWVENHVQEWVLAHEELERIAKERAELDGREGLAMLRALRAGVHRHLGYASFAQYVEKLFGYGFRTTDDKLRTAIALENLPELSAALKEGSLCWSAVRELARVATPATEREWLEAARGKTVRQIERLVSGKAPGDRPSDAGRPEARRHVLRFDVSAQTYATFREAAALIRRRSAEPMNDDALLLQVAREILQGPTDAGRSSYQISVTVCERCQRGVQHAAGGNVELPPEVVERMLCDAQFVGSVVTRVDVEENGVQSEELCSTEEHFGDEESTEGRIAEGHSSDARSGSGHSGNMCSGDMRSGDMRSGTGHSRDMRSGNGRSGDGHSGSGHSGSGHSGSGHSGSGHSGSGHSGNGRSGNGHSRDVRSGSGHSRDMRSGNGRSGDGHSGSGHSGSGHSGSGHSGDVPSGIGRPGNRPSGNGHSGGGHSGDMPSGDGRSSDRPSGPTHDLQHERKPTHHRQQTHVVHRDATTPSPHERRPTHDLQQTHVVHREAANTNSVAPGTGKPTRMTRPSTHEPRPTQAHAAHVGNRCRSGAELSAAAALVVQPKATQSIAPAVRRYVHHRDRGRCVVPGCTFGGFLDVHHLNPRAEGGGHDPENLVTLCDGHHTAVHTGQLSIEGSPSTKLRFLRADGTKYTAAPSARAIAASEQVFGALRKLGFSERQSKGAVRRVLETSEALSPPTLLRAALALLTQPLA